MADPEPPAGQAPAPEAPEEEKADEVPYLIALLEHPELNVRWRAAEALGEARDPRAVGPLIAALKDEYQDVSWIAAEAL
ncbi:MAG TPA: HEAT repeat domain-containing protein, partial [Methanomicrobiales archaeon]|nr:HEAT repeat domain-containing protein [Methanomicrobiales archaeon]